MEFSIIIPTYNRSRLLLGTLRHLEQLRYPINRYEVIVIDDGSNDGTYEQVCRFQSSSRLNLTILKQDKGGTSRARNQGIQRAKGVYCLFLDDDILPSPHLLQEHHKSHRGVSRCLVRGPVINIESPDQAKRRPPSLNDFSMNYFCTSNASLLKIYLTAAGMFDPDFERWEDAELGVRLKRLGIKRTFNLKAYVYHLKPPLSLSKRLQIAEKDGSAAAQLYIKYKTPLIYLRTGLHPINQIKSHLATCAILRKHYLLWCKNRPNSWKARMASALLSERAYLRAGIQKLRERNHGKGNKP